MSGKWVFAVDGRFTRRDGLVYSCGGAFPSDYWSRYLDHAQSLTVIGRRMPAESASAARTLTSAPNVTFELGPNLSGVVSRVACFRQVRSMLRGALAQADGVVVRLLSEYGLLAAVEAERMGLPWVAEMTGDPFDGLWNHGSWYGKVYAPIKAWRVRRAVARAPFVSYVTQVFLQRRYPSRASHQIACSNVEIDLPDPDVLEQRLERINRQKRPVVLGLIGTLQTRFKGIQTVMAALARMGRRGSIEFHVLGPGDEQPWVAEAEALGVADIVHFDGLRNPGQEVLEWLDDIDIYLQPSLSEGVPRASIEAMSRGCPVIGSTCAGIPELIKSKWCIEPGDDAHLAALIECMGDSPELQKCEANDNWREAHEYARNILNDRRHEMFAAFSRSTSQVGC